MELLKIILLLFITLDNLVNISESTPVLQGKISKSDKLNAEILKKVIKVDPHSDDDVKIELLLSIDDVQYKVVIDITFQDEKPKNFIEIDNHIE